jgi:hypothetical protein
MDDHEHAGKISSNKAKTVGRSNLYPKMAKKPKDEQNTLSCLVGTILPFWPLLGQTPLPRVGQANNTNVNTNMKLAMNKRNINYNFTSPRYFFSSL